MSVTPFFLKYGLYPRLNISLPFDFVNHFVKDWAHLFGDVHCNLSLELTLVIKRYKVQANRVLLLRSPTIQGM
jgi:hypothetical protein